MNIKPILNQKQITMDIIIDQRIDRDNNSNIEFEKMQLIVLQHIQEFVLKPYLVIDEKLIDKLVSNTFDVLDTISKLIATYPEAINIQIQSKIDWFIESNYLDLLLQPFYDCYVQEMEVLDGE